MYKYAVKRLGAPLTQAFGVLISYFAYHKRARTSYFRLSPTIDIMNIMI
jgi:hypothetical protein